MGAFVVRVIETRELVGIYFAPNVATLAELVDETFAPPDCEFRRLPGAGGISWSGRAPIIPRKIDEGGNTTEGVDFDRSEDLDFTEGWYGVLLDDDADRGWKREWRGDWLTKEEMDAARHAVTDAKGVMHLDPSNPAVMLQASRGLRTGYPIGDNDNTIDGPPGNTEDK